MAAVRLKPLEALYTSPCKSSYVVGAASPGSFPYDPYCPISSPATGFSQPTTTTTTTTTQSWEGKSLYQHNIISEARMWENDDFKTSSITHLGQVNIFKCQVSYNEIALCLEYMMQQMAVSGWLLA